MFYINYSVALIYKDGIYRKSHEKHMDGIAWHDKQPRALGQLFPELQPSETCKKGRSDFAFICQYGISGNILNDHNLRKGHIFAYGPDLEPKNVLF